MTDAPVSSNVHLGLYFRRFGGARGKLYNTYQHLMISLMRKTPQPSRRQSISLLFKVTRGSILFLGMTCLVVAAAYYLRSPTPATEMSVDATQTSSAAAPSEAPGRSVPTEKRPAAVEAAVVPNVEATYPDPDNDTAEHGADP